MFKRGVPQPRPDRVATVDGITTRRLRKATQVETRTCACSKTFQAPVRLYNRQVNAELARMETMCPECILREFPARTCTCVNPECRQEFRVQAGEVRATCSKTCRDAITALGMKPQSVVATKTTATRKKVSAPA